MYQELRRLDQTGRDEERDDRYPVTAGSPRICHSDENRRSLRKLTGSERPITHIAGAVGYNSLANFNRQF
jgi:AraC-like DNA-binding protein